MKILLLFITLLLSVQLIAQTSLKWTKLEDLSDSLKVASKPVLFKIETQWCSVCKLQDAKVFSDKKVQKLLINNYYLVKLDAESKFPMKYNDTTYNYLMYSVNRGVHQLAKKLAEEEGKLAYPTIVIIENYTIQKRLVGYLPKNDFLFWMKS
jgi:thioredoxin-related protein